jgi:GNAT superfamily N-acetyltransferase
MPIANKQLTMIREHLQDIPLFSLPPAYSLRRYQPGDEQVWLAIHAAADHYNTITPELFIAQFGNDPATLAQRQFYLCDSQQTAVGTATAWFNNNYRAKPYGQVHWVAILPHCQGLGLAKPLLTAICRRLRELGHNRAYLMTSSARLAAINLYLQFGFVAHIESAADQETWNRLLPQLKKPTIQSPAETI